MQRIVYKVTSIPLAIHSIECFNSEQFPMDKVLDSMLSDSVYIYTENYEKALSYLDQFIEEAENAVNEAKRRYRQ